MTAATRESDRLARLQSAVELVRPALRSQNPTDAHRLAAAYFDLGLGKIELAAGFATGKVTTVRTSLFQRLKSGIEAGKLDRIYRRHDLERALQRIDAALAGDAAAEQDITRWLQREYVRRAADVP